MKYQRNSRLKFDRNYPYQIYDYCKNILFETRHIVTEFNNVTNWICNNIFKLKIDIIQYIGWNWHIANKTCLRDNNINTGYPIYVIIEDFNDSNTFAYVEERELNDCKIILHINKENINDGDLFSKLQHEFTHIRTSYSRFYYDPLTSLNNKYNIENILYYANAVKQAYSLNYFPGSKQYFLFNNLYFKRAYNILYFLSKTEQQARINQVYKYIIRKYTFNDILNRKQLLQETNNITFLKDFIDAYDYFDECILDSRLFKSNICTSYYLNEFRYIQSNLLTKELMLKYFNGIDGKDQKYDPALSYVILKAKTVIEKSLTKYQTDILNIIDDAIFNLKEENFK